MKIPTDEQREKEKKNNKKAKQLYLNQTQQENVETT